MAALAYDRKVKSQMVMKVKGVEGSEAANQLRTEYQTKKKVARKEEKLEGDELETRDGVEFKGSTGEIGKGIFEKTYEYWPRHFTTAQKDDQRQSVSQHMNKRKNLALNSKKRVSFADHKASLREQEQPCEQKR